MRDDRKKEIINSMKEEMNQDDFRFDDLISRKEKRKKKKQQKTEEKILKDLEQRKKQRIKKELEQTQKIEKQKIKKALKEQKKKQQKQPEVEKITSVPTVLPKKKIHKFTRLFLSITSIGILIFWIFCIIDSFNRVNQIYTLVCSSLISLGCLFLVIAGLMTKIKPRSTSNVIGGACLLSFVIINTLVLTNVLTFPTQPVLLDFSNKSVNVAMKWANENKVTLTPTYEYSDAIKENHVITQSQKGEILAKNVKDLEVIVSKGPNYDLEANIPDMEGWDVDRVVKKIKELKLDLEKVNIEFNFNEAKRDTLYEQSKTGKIKRNDELTFKFSLGKEEDLKPVELINLKNKTKFDATLWLKRNGIKYELEYKFDDEISKGNVIYTNPKNGTIIKQSEMTVKIYISKGAKIVAPDFMKMSLDEIIKWASKNNVNLNYESEYSAKVKAGGIIRVSAQKGTTIEEGSTITVVTSKGALKMIDFKDDLSKLRSFAEQHGISIVEKQEFNKDVAQGKIISISHKPGQIIHSGESIEVIISKGNAIKIPSFIGMSESNAKSTCRNLGLDCTISYVYSSKEKGTVIDQNKSAGTEVSKDSNIVLSISAGSRPSNSGGNSNSNGSSGGDYNGGSDNQTPSCTPQTYTIGRDLNNIFNSGGDFNSVSNQLYSYFNAMGVKISVVGVSGTGMSPGSYISGIGPGSSVTSCNSSPYTISIAR